MKSSMVLIGLCLTGLVKAEIIDEAADADPRGRVEVSNVSGDVVVRGWDEARIRVTGTLGDGAERLDFVRDGKHTLIKVVYPDEHHHDADTDLDIQVPEGSDLRVTGVSADIDVENVRGVQNLQTVSGEVVAEVFGADFEARTVSGDIEVHGQRQSTLVTIITVSGDVDIMETGGELEASAVSGDIDVVAGTLSRARLRTTNGDITLGGELERGGRLDGETVNGDVEVMLADASNVEINVETFNGDIDHCFDVQVERKSRYGPGRELRVTRGDGESSVRIKTLNGDVEICGAGGNR
jgi:DUF4097 and DUF4098 domain-containing protein YvlB